MENYRKIAGLMLTFWIVVQGAESGPKKRTTQGLLIFLDDEESDNARESKFGTLSDDFATAFVQKAGPILVSASLVANVYNASPEKDKKPAAIYKRFKVLQHKINHDVPLTEEEWQEMKSIFVCAVNFTAETAAHEWVIKEVSPSLYLFLPFVYLDTNCVEVKDAQDYIPEGPLTQAEYRLGLKINHMKTVQAGAIKKPEQHYETATYFMENLWNVLEEKSHIFVTNREYPLSFKKIIPQWVIYIDGHGVLGKQVANLTIHDFKKFLDFLETKISTRLLYYSTCFGAGETNEKLYKNLKDDVEKTYSFAIITQALTDAVVENLPLYVVLKGGELQIDTVVDYGAFLDCFMTSDVIDYRLISSSLLSPELEDAPNSCLPQIKFPGLTWFSVIDSERVVSIGPVLAFARKNTLDIEKFFRKRREKLQLLGILLYTAVIPFEVIIDAKNPAGEPPAIISMIPGKAVHHIKKITSDTHKWTSLLESFLHIEDLEPEKIFIVDEVTVRGETEDEAVTVFGVIIHLTKHENVTYFLYNGALYKIIGSSIDMTKATLLSAREKELYGKLYRKKDNISPFSTFVSMDSQDDDGGTVDRRSTYQHLSPAGITDIEEKISQRISPYIKEKQELERELEAIFGIYGYGAE